MKLLPRVMGKLGQHRRAKVGNDGTSAQHGTPVKGSNSFGFFILLGEVKSIWRSRGRKRKRSRMSMTTAIHVYCELDYINTALAIW